PGDLGDALGPASAARTRPPVRRPDPRRDFLPRPARLPALPLPLDGTALAVSALPRVEHVRGREDRPREGECRGVRAIPLGVNSSTTQRPTPNQRPTPQFPNPPRQKSRRLNLEIQLVRSCTSVLSLEFWELVVAGQLGVGSCGVVELADSRDGAQTFVSL